MNYMEMISRIFLACAMKAHQQKWGFNIPKADRPVWEEAIASQIRKAISDMDITLQKLEVRNPEYATLNFLMDYAIEFVPEKGQVWRRWDSRSGYAVMERVNPLLETGDLNPTITWDRKVHYHMVVDKMSREKAELHLSKNLRKVLSKEGIFIPQGDKSPLLSNTRELSLKERNGIAQENGWCQGAQNNWPGEKFFLVDGSLAHIKKGPREWGDLEWQTLQIPITLGWSLVEMRDPHNKDIPEERYRRKAELLRAFLKEKEENNLLDITDTFRDRPRKLKTVRHGRSRAIKPRT